jgi:hypothetical protein
MTVIDSTISGNSAGAGGGINNYGTLTMIDSTVSGNSAKSDGGGIYNQPPATLTLTGSTVSGNDAANIGGGVFNGGKLTLTVSTFSGNHANANGASGGGGIYNNGTLTATNSTVSGNSAVWAAGGIANAVGTLTLNDSTVNGNSAFWIGGGILNDSAGTVTVTDSTISGNRTSGNTTNLGSGGGGGIYNWWGTVTVTDSTVSGNSAGSGGGMYNNGGTGTVIDLTGSTVSGNYAIYDGGGIYVRGTQVSIFNTIVAGNTAPVSPDVYGALTSHGHNLIGDGSGANGCSATDLIGTAVQPLDPKLGPLQNNGGLTATMALLPGSPALGAGDPTGAPAWDQRGPGFYRVLNGTMDIGAFEVQGLALAQGPTVAVDGSPADDQIVFSPGSNFGDLTVSVNGVAQGTIHPGVVQVHDDSGHDTITINGTTNTDDFVVGAGSITFDGIVISADSPVRWVLNGNGGNNVLWGPDTPGNQWYITATDAGSLGPVHFTHIGNLVGGASWDVFRLSAGVGVSGRIDGGAGGNNINYAAYTTGVTVNLATGVATNVAGGIANIQSVTGGSGNNLLIGNDQDNILIAGNGGNDTLIGNGGHDVLVGGDGNDLLIGGPNRSILIGGSGHSTLQGGNGDDLLIAGTTPWDAQVDTDALVAIRNEWIRMDESFAQSISNLRGQTSGGVNGSYVLNTTTVTETGAADTLTGGGGSNWFWADLTQDTITDLGSSDQVN